MRTQSLFSRVWFWIFLIPTALGADSLSPAKDLIQRQMEEASDFLRRTDLLFKADFRSFYNLGVVRAASGKYREAEEAFRRASALEPEDPSAHYQLALALLGQSKKGEAKKEFRAYLRLKPDAADRNEVEELLGSL